MKAVLVIAHFVVVRGLRAWCRDEREVCYAVSQKGKYTVEFLAFASDNERGDLWRVTKRLSGQFEENLSNREDEPFQFVPVVAEAVELHQLEHRRDAFGDRCLVTVGGRLGHPLPVELDARARERRDRTVPTGVSRIEAASS